MPKSKDDTKRSIIRFVLFAAAATTIAVLVTVGDRQADEDQVNFFREVSSELKVDGKTVRSRSTLGAELTHDNLCRYTGQGDPDSDQLECGSIQELTVLLPEAGSIHVAAEEMITDINSVYGWQISPSLNTLDDGEEIASAFSTQRYRDKISCSFSLVHDRNTSARFRSTRQKQVQATIQCFDDSGNTVFNLRS